MRRNNVQKISWGQSMQNFVKSYQFVLIPANLKRFPTKFLKEFVYTTKFCPTRKNRKVGHARTMVIYTMGRLVGGMREVFFNPVGYSCIA